MTEHESDFDELIILVGDLKQAHINLRNAENALEEKLSILRSAALGIHSGKEPVWRLWAIYDVGKRFGITERARKALEKHGILTLGEFVDFHDSGGRIDRMRNVGVTSIIALSKAVDLIKQESTL